ncbi:ribosomal RNA small subunit methyltransferase I [Philodulcilactobacillus myokoensis]|uniref:Ribosomal RNA small subunit methyltransferase I n=1 Tax=Philodulcilactobacillus myokoensis TaxID=2929573 RepID=A0A9W6B1N9_9LACO|nr:16S rRNA (cytidine(1402)-2'-O)-methyltransferase [Philodulcilactobacillus myokoensis]GLB47156.1 ribosomal RNA small subunit methyltransferase I [Philodulcilactobacillus myokoensis]
MKVQHSFAKNQSNGVLYLVPTPIGNLDDMSFRSVKVLKYVDLIAAEDTRHTKMLLNHFQIDTKEISLHEHNKDERVPELVQKLRQGVNMAQLSDAGMPSISDPGHELVVASIKADISVIPLPGPTAGMTSLIASGLSPQPFYFYGFLNRQNKEQLEELKKLNQRVETFIIYEAPHRLKKTLKNMVKILGKNRKAAICRELTKRFEEFDRGTLTELLDYIDSKPILGEFVIIVEGNHHLNHESDATKKLANLSINEQINYYIKQGDKPNPAIKKIAKMHNMKKQEVYNLYHHIKK